ncbi:MAG: ATP-binding protein [Nitrospirae bacterium]|nr:ATP-binding protein [Nitrospirota bacterium]
MADDNIKMDFDIEGYVLNEPLPTSKPLMPLFEAVVNSIYAVSESNNPMKHIKISIKRNMQEHNLFPDSDAQHSNKPIIGFIVEDNGIGFNDTNFKSFNTLYSLYKKKAGGKGIGRFSWLHAFNEIKIESVFNKNGQSFERTFDFSIDLQGVGNHRQREINKMTTHSIVYLNGYVDRYSYYCPKKASTIAQNILEHCLFTFINGNQPEIQIIDDDTNEIIHLNNLYNDQIKRLTVENTAILNGQKFHLTHLKLLTADPSRQHTIHLCANDREVKKISAEKKIPALSKKIMDDDGRSYYYLCYVNSRFLDENVNSKRTGFNFNKEGELPFDSDITEESLSDFLIEEVKEHLKDFIDNHKSNIIGKFEILVNEKHPEYKPILKYVHTYADALKTDVTDDELLRILNEIHLKKDLETRNTGDQVIANEEYGEQYKKLYDLYIENLNDVSKMNLSKYVIHRKAILRLLEKLLQYRADGKYELESSIHSLIFPMGTTSYETPYESSNLWIIDEKLAFHKYLASDKRLPVSKKEPDILIINNPAAFSELDENIYSSVVIIELKRPENDTYTDNDNPIDQILNYVENIKKENITDFHGRPINTTDSTAFYCYILADLTPKLKNIAQKRDFQLLSDNQGFFFYNKTMRAHIEIISFDKLLIDAKKRNNAIFRHLGLL